MTETGVRRPGSRRRPRWSTSGCRCSPTPSPRQGFDVVNVDWRIPAGGDADARRCPAPAVRAAGRGHRPSQRRGRSAVSTTGTPQAVAVRPAGEVVPGLEGRMLLHCGPPIGYADASTRCGARCGPPSSPRAGPTTSARGRPAARRAARSSSQPANRHDACVPMVTALGPSQPVWVVENTRPAATGPSPPSTRARARRRGSVATHRRPSSGCASSPSVAGPLLDDAVRSHGPVDVLGIAAQGLQMGDDVHIRVQASTNLLLRDLLPHLAASRRPPAGRGGPVPRRQPPLLPDPGDGRLPRALDRMGDRRCPTRRSSRP